MKRIALACLVPLTFVLSGCIGSFSLGAVSVRCVGSSMAYRVQAYVDLSGAGAWYWHVPSSGPAWFSTSNTFGDRSYANSTFYTQSAERVTHTVTVKDNTGAQSTKSITITNTCN